MDIDDPTEDQNGVTRGEASPEFFIKRGEDVFVPLVALDQLPAWINVGGMSRTCTAAEMADYQGTLLESYYSGGEYEVRVGHNLDICQPSPESEGAQNVAASLNTPQLAPDSAFITNEEMKKQTYHPVTPGIMGGKKYCTHWIRTGECDFMQQGCIFKHCIPDQATLESLGFRSYPRWFREMPHAYQVQNAEGLVSTVPRGPFNGTRKLRGVQHHSPNGLAPATSGYASEKFRHTWPYPNTRAAKHGGSQSRHVSESAIVGGENAGRAYYDAQRAERFIAASKADRALQNDTQHTREVDRQHHYPPHNVSRIETAETYPQDNGYVPTPRAYEESDDEASGNGFTERDSASHHAQNPRDQQRSTSRTDEEEARRKERYTPQNFYVEPTPDKRDHRSSKLTHASYSKNGNRSQCNERVPSTPNHGAGNSRGYESPRTHRKDSSRHNGNENYRQYRRYPAPRHGSSRPNVRVKDMPRLQYPPQSHGQGQAKADFYVRTDSRSPSRTRAYANDRNNDAPMEDLISFD